MSKTNQIPIYLVIVHLIIQISSSLTPSPYSNNPCFLEIVSTYHSYYTPRGSRIGAYFNFLRDDADCILGFNYLHATTYNVWYSGDSSIRHVKLWRDCSGTNCTGHGRKDPFNQSFAGDWDIDQYITFNDYPCQCLTNNPSEYPTKDPTINPSEFPTTTPSNIYNEAHILQTTSSTNPYITDINHVNPVNTSNGDGTISFLVIVLLILVLLICLCTVIVIYFVKKNMEKDDSKNKKSESTQNVKQTGNLTPRIRVNSVSVLDKEGGDASGQPGDGEMDSKTDNDASIKEIETLSAPGTLGGDYQSDVYLWLQCISHEFVKYFDDFVCNGYDSMDLIGKIKHVSELKQIGIETEADCDLIILSINNLHDENMQKWLKDIGWEHYMNNFIESGYNSISFIQHINNISQLKEIGIENENDCFVLLQEISKLDVNVDINPI